jgi:hypothetical protein
MELTQFEVAAARFTGSISDHLFTWGSAPLHPRLYTVAALRGLTLI